MLCQSKIYSRIIDALFTRPTPDLLEISFDTDVAVQANSIVKAQEEERDLSAAELLAAIWDIRADLVDLASLRALAMSSSALVAAMNTLKRASCTGKFGRIGKGMAMRATQRTVGILAMRASTAAAVTGALDGVYGADPGVIGTVCEKIKAIFTSHGAAQLRSPLLRPRPNSSVIALNGGPVEVMNSNGSILLMPEDLTAAFGTYLHIERTVDIRRSPDLK